MMKPLTYFDGERRAMALPGQVLLTTDRLVLRPYRIEDFEDMYRLAARPETYQFPRKPALGREESWARLLRIVGHWAALGYGFFAVREREGGRFVGEAGLARFQRDMEPDVGDLPEATWTMMSEVQGMGYATEAARAAQDWAERNLRLERTMCIIHPDNRPSLRVAEKLGFGEFGRTTYQGNPAVLLERRASAPAA